MELRGNSEEEKWGRKKKNENWSGKAKHALSQKKAHQPGQIDLYKPHTKTILL